MVCGKSLIFYQQVSISYQMEFYPSERINRGDKTSMMKSPFLKKKRHSPGTPIFERIRQLNGTHYNQVHK